MAFDANEAKEKQKARVLPTPELLKLNRTDVQKA
jgi:hypothetical protein